MAQPTLTIIQDTREQRPLLFPANLSVRGRMTKIEVARNKLDAGDYMLWECGTAIVERKAGLEEIRKNVITKDLRRVREAFARLVLACPHPILLLEASVQQLMTPTQRVPDPGPVMQRFFDELASFGIELWMVGACLHPRKRRVVGELVLRKLIAYRDIGVDKP